MRKLLRKIQRYLMNPKAEMRVFYLRYRWIYMRLCEMICGVHMKDHKQIPIVINNFNQLTYLKLLIERLEDMGYTNIHIIDNDSTYPPLLDYYKTSKHNIHFLDHNLGYKALWETELFLLFRKGYYVYTDSDVVPTTECPDDFLLHLYNILQRHPKAQKIGLSLKTDDLPDYFANKPDVIKWENALYRNEIETGVFNAQVDTTFALYRPFFYGDANFVELHLRTKKPFEARHLPWYANSSDLTEEQQYYIDHCKKITHWSKQMKGSK